MAKKKKRTTLPRVSVLAFNRKELAEFAEAVERLRLYVEELRVILATRPVKTAAKKTPTPAPSPEVSQ